MTLLLHLKSSFLVQAILGKFLIHYFLLILINLNLENPIPSYIIMYTAFFLLLSSKPTPLLPQTHASSPSIPRSFIPLLSNLGEEEQEEEGEARVSHSPLSLHPLYSSLFLSLIPSLIPSCVCRCFDGLVALVAVLLLLLFAFV